MKRLALVLAGLAVLLGAAEWALRLPFLRTPSPFEDAGGGRVRRSEAWGGLLPFEAAREPDRLRVVWMGASTVAGVPYAPVMSPPGWLQYILTWRDADVEVVPLAGPGLTCESLARLLPHLLDLSPDVIVVTTGHNEYLNSGTLLDPTWWHHSQLLQRTRSLLGLRGASIETLPRPERDFDHAAIVASFREHVAAMQAAADEAGVALLFTAPIQNLRENPPILGDDPRLAEDADAAFARGKALLASGDVAGARAAFLAARDRDRWPHRATSSIRAALDAAARRVVPVDEAFDAASPHGLPGFELFADHCHPNPAGQRLLASVVADAIEDLGLMPATGRRGQAPTVDEGKTHFGLDDEAIARTRALLARGYVGFALIAGRYGRMAELAEDNLESALALHAMRGEMDTTRALLALLRGDPEAARGRLETARTEAPEMLANLQRAHDRYPWVRAAFARNGLRLAGGRLEELADG